VADKRYYIVDAGCDTGPEPGSVVTWDGEYWTHPNAVDDPVMVVRFLWDFEGFHFLLPRSDLIEVVAEKAMEDPDEKHSHPVGQRKVWNTHYKV
jgi:hypothetical protein